MTIIEPDLINRIKGFNCDVLVGADALCQLAGDNETDVVVTAIGGAAGLESSIAAAEAGASY